MNVNLTPELEEIIEAKVRSGLYNNRSEVVREALRLLAERDHLREANLARLRAALAEGVKQADRGELLDGEETVQEIRGALSRRRSGGK